MPTNLYGPGDNFDLETSHVLPAMIRKFHDAKEANARTSRGRGGASRTVRLWGTGSALREFLHVDDLARAAVDLTEQSQTGLFNIGSGEEVSIRELAAAVAGGGGFAGAVGWGGAKPGGEPPELRALDQNPPAGRGARTQ